MGKIIQKKALSTSGAILHIRICKTKKQPLALIQINHGLTEHSARYEHFMHYLAKHGFHSIAHDHRGHGLTKAEQLPPGQFSRHDGVRKVIKDVSFINTKAQNEFPELPIICFGHCLGGPIAANYAMKNPSSIKGLAIWNANFKARQYTPLPQILLAIEAFFIGSDMPGIIMPKVTFYRWAKSIKNAKTYLDWLTHDRAKIKAIAHDELSKWQPSISMWQDSYKFINRATHPQRIKNLTDGLPIHLVSGSHDPSTEYGQAVDWFAKILRQNGCTNIVHHKYQGFRHDTLNETKREKAMENFVNWANNVVKT